MVQLLDSGADVCLPNTSPPSVIESQIAALLRRSTAEAPPVTDPNRFMRGEIEIIPRYHQVKVRGEAVNLCRKEFKLLLLLAGSPGTVFSIAEISRYLWAQENTFSRTHTIESMISTLRRKLEADPRHPVYILTTRGVGYHFVSNYEELRRFFGE